MEEHMIHVTGTDYTVSRWSGGTTTQIAISPPDAEYANRDFRWRISSATVELEESDFTPLPDYDRLIAPLRGEMTLTHGGGAPIALKPIQVHAFDGGADTHSVGCCTDFNLMLRKGACTGRMYPVQAVAGQKIPFAASAQEKEFVLYCVQGQGRVSYCGETAVLKPGEAVYVRVPAYRAVAVECPERAVFMAAEIQAAAPEK